MSLQMKTTAPEPEPTDAAAAPKKKSMMPVIIAVVVLLLAAIGGFVGFKVLASKKTEKKSTAPVVLKVGEVLPLDEFMLNLADPGDDHYLKTTISLGLKEGLSSEKFKDKVPQIRDSIIMVLTAKHLNDLRTPAGKIALKKQLRTHINSTLGETDIADVYFEAFATQ